MDTEAAKAPDMGEAGIREFIKWWYPQLRKEGLVVDVRDNSVGNISELLIERLAATLRATSFARNLLPAMPTGLPPRPAAPIKTETQ